MSVIWMTAQKWVTRIGSLLTIIILTRTLAPEDFGLAAAATTLMPLVYVLADIGFSTYIVQADTVEKKTLDTAFWFALACGLVLAGVIVVAAPGLAILLNLPEVVPLLRVMSLSVFMIALGSVPVALLRRRMNFKLLAMMEVSSALVAQVVAIVLAFLGAGAWALVLQIMVTQAVSTVWVWIAARWRPGVAFSRDEFKVMGAFGIHVAGGALTGVARAWAETAIVVAGLGVREMGYLNIAQRLVQTAQDLTISAIVPVSMVAFSKVRDPERLRPSYLRAASIAHAVVTPLMIAIAVTSPVLIPFLFGADKAPSAGIAPALAIIVLINVGWGLDQGLHLGMGRPGRWLILVLASYSVSVALLATSVQYGLMALLGMWIITSCIEAITRWIVNSRLIGATPWQMAVPLLGVAGPAVVSAAVGLGLMRLLAGGHSFVVLAITGTVVVLVYLVALRLLRSQTFTDTIRALPGRLSRMLEWSLPKRARARRVAN